MDARFMQMHNFVLTREIIINSIFPVDRMRELNFHRETAVPLSMVCILKFYSLNARLRSLSHRHRHYHYHRVDCRYCGYYH